MIRQVEEDIESISNAYEMLQLVEQITENILFPVSKGISSCFLKDGGGGPEPLSGRDLIAMRRLHWLGEKLEGKVQQYLADPIIVNSNSDLVRSILKLLRQWRFVSMPKVYPRLNDDFKRALLDELMEELLYRARSCLPSPLDETVWSALAVDLTRKTAQTIAQYLFCYPGPVDMQKQLLGQALLKLAKEAALSLRDASNTMNSMRNNAVAVVDNRVNQLSFKSRWRHIKEKYYILDKESEVTGCNRSIVSQYEPPADGMGDSDKRSPQFRWTARRDVFRKGDAVNEQWYLENQVFLPVHLLASTCIDWACSEEDNNPLYSLEKLCEAIHLDTDGANKALSQGVVIPT